MNKAPEGEVGDSSHVLVLRNHYEDILHTVQDLQTKYKSILDDKQRWRNFAILSAAMQMVAQRAFSEKGAIETARTMLTMIEGDSNGNATAQGPDPGR